MTLFTFACLVAVFYLLIALFFAISTFFVGRDVVLHFTKKKVMTNELLRYKIFFIVVAIYFCLKNLMRVVHIFFI